jgi:Icc-related predicted phosphoesterase
VAGNHDNPEIIDIVKKLNNFTVLNGQIVTISGIKVTGFADPMADTTAVQFENTEEVGR